MTKNVGSLDRNIRIIAGILILAWGVFAQSWLGLIGAVALATGLMSWCPAYTLLKLNTNKV